MFNLQVSVAIIEFKVHLDWEKQLIDNFENLGAT